MATTAYSTLKIGGRLTGPPPDNLDAKEFLEGLKAQKPDQPMSEYRDFLPQGWKLEDWDYEMVAGGETGNETVISFTAEAEFEGEGAIYDHRGVLTLGSVLFLHYRDRAWHKALKAALLELDAKVKTPNPSRVIERIWFRDWTFYCGNGGDS